MKFFALLISLFCLCLSNKASAEESLVSAFMSGWAMPMLHGKDLEGTYPLDFFDSPREPTNPQALSYGGNLGATLRLTNSFRLEARGIVGHGSEGRLILGGGGDAGLSLTSYHHLLLGGAGWIETDGSIDGVTATGGPGYLWTPTSWIRVGVRVHAGFTTLLDDIRVANDGSPHGGHSGTWVGFAPSLELGVSYP